MSNKLRHAQELTDEIKRLLMKLEALDVTQEIKSLQQESEALSRALQRSLQELAEVDSNVERIRTETVQLATKLHERSQEVHQDKAWLEGDLATLPNDDWSDAAPGKPVRYEPGIGFVAMEAEQSK